MDRSEYFDEPDALVTAVLLCDFEAAVSLVEQGVDVNAKDKMGNTALIIAIEEDWAGTHWVEFLLKNGADVNQPDDDGDSPLDVAKYRKRRDIASVLVRYGGIGREGPSRKEMRDDQIYDAFESANAVKRLISEIERKENCNDADPLITSKRK
jgi:ankyrin repeat protein